LAYIHNSAE